MMLTGRHEQWVPMTYPVCSGREISQKGVDDPTCPAVASINRELSDHINPMAKSKPHAVSRCSIGLDHARLNSSQRPRRRFEPRLVPTRQSRGRPGGARGGAGRPRGGGGGGGGRGGRGGARGVGATGGETHQKSKRKRRGVLY